MEFHGKILIVDDEPHIRRFFGIVLKKIGTPTIIEAGNGTEALALYAQHQPDLVLMDINMPGMSGVETLEKLRTLHPGARVVMLTSIATRQVVQQSIDCGAINFVRKDIPREQIAGLLTEIIRRHIVNPGEKSSAGPGSDEPPGTPNPA